MPRHLTAAVPCLVVAGALVQPPLAAAAPSEEMQRNLALHNVFRCMHGVDLLKWDDGIAANAQAWADNATFEHSSDEARTFNGQSHSENLAIGIGDAMDGEIATRMWYGEIMHTDPWGRATSLTDSKPAGEYIGHYTALIWKGSVSMGCGRGAAVIPNDGRTGTSWVCQYGPGGNVQGQFSMQVMAPVKTVAECGGLNSDIPKKPPMRVSERKLVSERSTCTPEPLLFNGGLCVKGYQCESGFCCPRNMVCMADGRTGISSNDIKLQTTDAKVRSVIVKAVMGGTCRNSAYPDTNNCHPEYMRRYEAGTWVTFNDVPGLKCGDYVRGRGDDGAGGMLISGAATLQVRSAGTAAALVAAAVAAACIG